MSWAGEPLDAYVGARHVGIWRGRSALGWDNERGGAEGLLALLRSARQRPRRWPKPGLRLWLSGALARALLVRPVRGLQRWAEAEAAAAAQATSEFERSEPMRVWLQAMPDVQATLAVAAQAEGLNAMRRSAAECALRVTSIRPWWARALNQTLQSMPSALDGIAVADSEALTFLAGTGCEWRDATSYLPVPTSEQEQDIIHRRMTLLGLGSDRVRRASMNALGANGTPASLEAAISPVEALG